MNMTSFQAKWLSSLKQQFLLYLAFSILMHYSMIQSVNLWFLVDYNVVHAFQVWYWDFWSNVYINTMFGSSLLPCFVWGGSYFIHHLYLFTYIAWCSCLTATRGVPSIPFFCCWCFSIFSFSRVFCNTVQFILSISFELQLPITESLNTTGGHFVEDIIHSTKNSKQDTMVPPGKACMLTNNRFSNCHLKDKFHMQTGSVQLRYFGFIDVWTKLCKSKQDY